MFVHELPTTGAISFSDFLVTTTFISELAQATELRARLRTVLKENRRGGDAEEGGRDWLRIVKAIDEYLPYLFSIFNCVQTDDLILRHEPEFSWRTTLSSSFLRSPPRIALPGLYYELCSSLLLSGAALSNLAASIAASLGDYERDRHLSDAERKTKDERLKWAADTLCRACGVFEYLAEVLIPQWENDVGRIEGRPPDVTREVTMALSKLALADAQTLAIRKLLSPSLSMSIETITPGPPLPKSHPSPSLLAKLHLNVAALYESARSLAKTVGKKPATRSDAYYNDNRPGSSGGRNDRRGTEGTVGSPSPRSGGRDMFSKLKGIATGGNGGNGDAPDGDMEVGGPLLRYLSASAGLARALAYKWLGVDAGEAGGRYGEAIAFLRMAKEALEEGSGSSTGLTAGFRERGNKETRDEMRARREEELQSVEHWLKSYGKLNDTVAFQPIPRSSDLQSRIPAGRSALSSKPFKPPLPTFGPGSPGFVSEGMRRLGLNEPSDGQDHGARAPISPGGRTDEGAEYAGAGAYY